MEFLHSTHLKAFLLSNQFIPTKNKLVVFSRAAASLKQLFVFVKFNKLYNVINYMSKSININPDEREMDMLLTAGEQETIALTTMALHAIDVPAVSRTGPQAGILTDPSHTRARITRISGGDIREQLDAGKVVILAGFQGHSPDGQITTLGRGGSDLSAIAIAAALKADLCQICTDVDGVYTADPRIVSNARKLDEIAYEEMLELASSGSKVMQNRAVEFAQKFKVIFEVLLNNVGES